MKKTRPDPTVMTEAQALAEYDKVTALMARGRQTIYGGCDIEFYFESVRDRLQILGWNRKIEKPLDH
jgi:hypothetical protein